MQPSSTLVAASADPVVEIEDQHLNPGSQASLTGKLLNQSGQVVNVAHVLGTFYDSTGQLIWVSDGYVDRALLPQSLEPFAVEIPKSLSTTVHNFHVVVNQFSLGKS